MATTFDSRLLPAIEVSGLWKLKAPFDVRIIPTQVYTCKRVSSFAAVVAAGFDVYKDYYLPYGIDEELFKEDAANGVAMISIVSPSGDWIDVPSSYLLQYPSNNGVKYVSWAIGAALGPMPEYVQLDYLVAQIRDKIKDTIGVDVDVRPMIISAPEIISNETHAGLESARRNNIAESTTDWTKLQEMTRQRDALAFRNQQLEQFIKDNADKLQP